MAKQTTDVVVIGSGIGGLCAGALLAKYGYEVLVCESHSLAGGAAHSFEYRGFHFDSGPSLYSGLMDSSSANPLKQVLDALAVELPCYTYDTWGCWLPEGQFETQVGAAKFQDVLAQLRGPQAVQEWQHLQQIMEPLKDAAIALPPAAIRADWQVLRSARLFLPNFLKQGRRATKLTGDFARVYQNVIHDEFLRNWLDLLSFLISGLPADSTSAAAMSFMFADWYRPGVSLEYPVNGSAGLVTALVSGLEKFGGELQLNAHVSKIIIAGNQIKGVLLRNGQVINVKKGVVANLSAWDLCKLLPQQTGAVEKLRSQRTQLPACASFMHLHLGINGDGIAPDLPCHHIYVKDWSLGIDAPQNVVLISIPSLLDPSLAPPGKHAIHVYTPGNEPYAIWQGLDRRSADYQALKETRSQIMWEALEKVIPDVRKRCEVTLVGTPLTHERFLRRDRGSYGPALAAGKAIFPGPRTGIQGLLCCGDSTFPGIGLPAVAASGMLAANTWTPVDKHLAMLKEIGL
ncbi:MAG: NAD(P)/FAD-dependent oxidoreductase [Cyanobacteria bacterium P01_H01_bin.15]